MPREFLNKIKTSLQKPLPGESAQRLLAPFNRPVVSVEELGSNNHKLSAVMILFCSDHDGRLYLPLIQRPAYDGVHSGQISFPGGKFELGDHSLEETAVRECREEIGLNEHMELLGKLTKLFIPVSGFLVEPFVAFYPERNPEFTPQITEVQSVIKLYLEDLLDDNNIQRGEIEVANLKIMAPYIKVAEKQVWGATAMILSELKELMRSI